MHQYSISRAVFSRKLNLTDIQMGVNIKKLQSKLSGKTEKNYENWHFTHNQFTTKFTVIFVVIQN